MVKIGRGEESHQVHEPNLTSGFPSLQYWRFYNLSDILRDDRRDGELVKS